MGLLDFDTNDPIPGYIKDLGILRRVGDRVKAILGSVAGVALVWDGSDWLESIAVALQALALKIIPASSTTAQLVFHLGPSTTEGFERLMIVKTVSPNAAATALFTWPANSIPRYCGANAQANLTGGGTSVTWSIGKSGDVDAYGTAGYPSAADALTKNSKSTWFANGDPLAASEDILLYAAATGGASAGDTKLSVGSVKVVAIYDAPVALADA